MKALAFSRSEKNPLKSFNQKSGDLISFNRIALTTYKIKMRWGVGKGSGARRPMRRLVQ